MNEAMAAGKAVLVSDKVGCAVDLVRSGENGEVFRAGDTTRLTEKLSALTADRDALKRMGDASRRIIENWSFDNQTAAILTELKKL